MEVSRLDRSWIRSVQHMGPIFLLEWFESPLAIGGVVMRWTREAACPAGPAGNYPIIQE